MAQPSSKAQREYSSFIESPTRENASAIEVVSVDGGRFGLYDEISASYPTQQTEIYTYKLNSNIIGTITVTYQDSSKELLTSVVYNAV